MTRKNNIRKFRGKIAADLLIVNASELLTLDGSSQEPRTGDQMKLLGLIQDGALAIQGSKIVAVGKSEEILRGFEAKNMIDASGRTILPGFIDPHTHLVFSGSREKEFQMRLAGASYMEILEAGGGILETVHKTREASLDELVYDGQKTLDIMLEHGTTTVEAKSGYGLTVEDELKLLHVMDRLNSQHVIDIVPTFMGAHAIPHEYKNAPEKYVDLVIEEMIPLVSEKKLAEFCDVFCEKGVFTISQSRRILSAAKRAKLKPKIHADEMSTTGGTELAADIKAASADHLLFSSIKGLEAIAQQKVMAVLLPAAAFCLMMGRYADARKMMHLGVPVTLGTDFGPTCWIENQQLIIALACRFMKLTPAEAIVAATINAAHAIDKGTEIGSLEIGKKADIIICDIPNHNFLGYRFGVNLVNQVIKNGKLVFSKEKKNLY
ncbi:MAG: imidazolonepropionase [Candidatus Bathyarchaeota archaeon]|jgi:imidazolonepropionase